MTTRHDQFDGNSDDLRYCKALGQLVDGRRCFNCFYDEGWVWHLECKKQNLVDPESLGQRALKKIKALLGKVALI